MKNKQTTIQKLDIKKALVCQLFAGSRRHLPDGITTRGDINILLLGMEFGKKEKNKHE